MNPFARKRPDDRPSETDITFVVELLKESHPAFEDITAERRRAIAVGLLRVKRAAEEGRFDDDR